MLGTELFWFCIIKGAKLNCARFLSYKVANYGIRVLLFLKQLPDFFKTAVNSLSVFKVDMANLNMYSIFTHHLCTCLRQPCFLCLRTILMSKKQKKKRQQDEKHS